MLPHHFLINWHTNMCEYDVETTLKRRCIYNVRSATLFQRWNNVRRRRKFSSTLIQRCFNVECLLGCIDKFSWNLKFHVGFFNAFLLEKYYTKLAFKNVHNGRIMHRLRCSCIFSVFDESNCWPLSVPHRTCTSSHLSGVAGSLRGSHRHETWKGNCASVWLWYMFPWFIKDWKFKGRTSMHWKVLWTCRIDTLKNSTKCLALGLGSPTVGTTSSSVRLHICTVTYMTEISLHVTLNTNKLKTQITKVKVLPQSQRQDKTRCSEFHWVFYSYKMKRCNISYLNEHEKKIKNITNQNI